MAPSDGYGHYSYVAPMDGQSGLCIYEEKVCMVPGMKITNTGRYLPSGLAHSGIGYHSVATTFLFRKKRGYRSSATCVAIVELVKKLSWIMT